MKKKVILYVIIILILIILGYIILKSIENSYCKVTIKIKSKTMKTEYQILYQDRYGILVQEIKKITTFKNKEEANNYYNSFTQYLANNEKQKIQIKSNKIIEELTEDELCGEINFSLVDGILSKENLTKFLEQSKYNVSDYIVLSLKNKRENISFEQIQEITEEK